MLGTEALVGVKEILKECDVHYLQQRGLNRREKGLPTISRLCVSFAVNWISRNCAQRAKKKETCILCAKTVEEKEAFSKFLDTV